MKFVMSFGLFDSADIKIIQPLKIYSDGKEITFPTNTTVVDTQEECLAYAKNSINSLYEHPLNTVYDKSVKFWSSRDELLYTYWNDKSLINISKWFAKELKKYEISSVYEIGTYNGRNLKYIYDELPNIEIGGLDINKLALDFARMILPIGTKLDLVDALNVNTDEKYDVVFTHDVLAYIPPDAINSVISNCINKSSKYVIHIERKGNKNYVLRGPIESNPEKISEEFKWEPEISEIYNEMGFNTVQHDLQLEGSDKSITLTVVNKQGKF